MNRRIFLTGLGALVGGIALDKAIPLGRVWSFPKEIKCVNASAIVTQYADFIPIPDLIVETYLDPVILNAATELSYKEGLFINQCMRMTRTA